MKTVFIGLPLALLAATPALAQQDMARVISTVPAIQQVATPQQYCTQQPVVTSTPKSGAGAILGAIAGGAMGNAIGNGSGRAAATALGVVGGAFFGDRVEGTGSQVQNVQQCQTQTVYENRTVGYDVTYEYAGRQYTTRMASDPGAYINVQVSPVGSMPVPPPVTSAPPVTYVQPQPGVVVGAVPAPVVVYSPAYAPAYPPVGVSLNLGYTHGRGGWGYGPRW
ncbi:MAG: glycine zipper 2TM domain-containing protein [Burkholderiales bacterium]|nr:glycine zipper 2TM domain-containing protein [Burkholderiales bacterium]